MGSFKVTIDRIENNIAVLLVRDDESVMINIPLILLPEGSREGDILDIYITRDVRGTETAKREVSTLLEQLQNKSENKNKNSRGWSGNETGTEDS
jgi:hypothetical protein